MYNLWTSSEQFTSNKIGGYVDQNTFDLIQNEWVWEDFLLGRHDQGRLYESGSERDKGLNTFIPLALAVQSLTGEYSLTPTPQKKPRGSTKQKAVKGSLRGYAILNCLVLTLHLFIICAPLEIVQGKKQGEGFCFSGTVKRAYSQATRMTGSEWARVEERACRNMLIQTPRSET